MQVSPFNFETAPPGEGRKEPRREADARVTMSASPPTADDDAAREDTPEEEPGYGHGV